MHADLLTPYEKGNQNQTTLWTECIAFYEMLAKRYPQVLRFEQIGVSDGGVPIHAGVVSADGVFDRERIKREGRTVFFNNNGIHPGEPEGIDACMAIVRDLCTQPERLAALGSTVLLFVPVYNVDGCLNRANTSRVNQDGPELFGFRGNSRHLDLNRDFITCDTLNAKLSHQLGPGRDGRYPHPQRRRLSVHDDADPHAGREAGERPRSLPAPDHAAAYL